MICPARLSDLHCHRLPFAHYSSATLPTTVFPEAVLETRILVQVDHLREDPRQHGEEWESVIGHINECITSVNNWGSALLGTLCVDMPLSHPSSEWGRWGVYPPCPTPHCWASFWGRNCPVLRQVPIQGWRTLFGRHRKPWPPGWTEGIWLEHHRLLRDYSVHGPQTGSLP